MRIEKPYVLCFLLLKPIEQVKAFLEACKMNSIETEIEEGINMFKTVKGWKIVPASDVEIEVENALEVVLDNGEIVWVYPPKSCKYEYISPKELKAFVEACKTNGIEIDEQKVDADIAEQGPEM